jgi:hypothetical protein
MHSGIKLWTPVVVMSAGMCILTAGMGFERPMPATTLAFESIGDASDALEETERILRTEPAHPGALYSLGALDANPGNTALAREYRTRLRAVNPKAEGTVRAKEMLAQLPPPPISTSQGITVR